MKMPRQARKRSNSGIYHIILRGINRQRIFENREDYEKFLSILKKYKDECKYNVFAYCLMSNHIHLLIQETDESLENIMKKITVKYVYWYNVKYQRTGHLFQDRFKSEPVEDDRYFLTVIRYIHQNPVKAGICKKPEDYEFSSYNNYFEKEPFIDFKFVFDMIDERSFADFNNEITSEKCLEIEEQKNIKVTDEQAKKIIEKYSKCSTVTEFQALNPEKRNKYLKMFREKGLSIRQISRLTGISYYVVQKS